MVAKVIVEEIRSVGTIGRCDLQRRSAGTPDVCSKIRLPTKCPAGTRDMFFSNEFNQFKFLVGIIRAMGIPVPRSSGTLGW